MFDYNLLKINQKFINFLILISWLSFTYLYVFFDLINFVYSKNMILLLGSFFFILYFLNPINISIKIVISIYVFIRLSFLIFALLDEDFLFYLMDNGDASEYHIPMILSITGDNFFTYITNYEKYATETGKFTHIIYAFFYYFMNPFLNFTDVNNVMISAYAINTFFLIITSLYLYKVLQNEGIENKFIVLAISLILFSPFVLAWSSYVLKETFYVCLIILTMISIIRKNYILLILISLFFLVDRMYMLYLKYLFSYYLIILEKFMCFCY